MCLVLPETYWPVLPPLHPSPTQLYTPTYSLPPTHIYTFRSAPFLSHWSIPFSIYIHCPTFFITSYCKPFTFLVHLIFISPGKSGCSPEEVIQLVKYINEECPRISLVGLMTIGSFDHNPSTGPNPDFEVYQSEVF